MPLINCKIHLELNWTEGCILSSAGDSPKFKITGSKLHVPTVTLSTKDNVNFTKQLNNGFKISVYWNNYQTIPAKVIINNTNIYELLSASFQATDNDETGIKNNRKYFLPRAKIENYNVLIDGRIFFDQPVNDLIKQYDEVRKVSTGQGDGYTTRCLSDYAYFKDSYRLIELDLS